MIRMTNASDTLATARRLETDFGMDKRAAEGVATAINDHLTQNVATKADVEQLEKRLDTKIDHLDEKLTGRIDGLACVAIATFVLTAVQVYFGVR